MGIDGGVRAGDGAQAGDGARAGNRAPAGDGVRTGDVVWADEGAARTGKGPEVEGKLAVGSLPYGSAQGGGLCCTGQHQRSFGFADAEPDQTQMARGWNGSGSHDQIGGLHCPY